MAPSKQEPERTRTPAADTAGKGKGRESLQDVTPTSMPSGAAQQPSVKRKAKRPAPLPAESIAASRLIPTAEAEKLARRLAQKSNYSDALVVALDIRDSTTFMLHVERFGDYARILANFIAVVRLAAARRGGWFDKFTGDGALLFWPTESLDARLLVSVLDFATDCQLAFIRTTMKAFRVVAGCVPETFGLSIGIDFGRCLISNLAHDPELEVDGKRVPREATQGTITVLGRAVVGAVRMVSAARTHQIVLNEGPGELFHRLWRRTTEGQEDTTIQRVLVDNKDLGGKQFAYLLGRRPIVEALKQHYNPETPDQA